MVLRSKHICVFSDHIKEILPQTGGGGGGGGAPLPNFPLWLDPCSSIDSYVETTNLLLFALFSLYFLYFIAAP